MQITDPLEGLLTAKRILTDRFETLARSIPLEECDDTPPERGTISSKKEIVRVLRALADLDSAIGAILGIVL